MSLIILIKKRGRGQRCHRQWGPVPRSRVTGGSILFSVCRTDCMARNMFGARRKGRYNTTSEAGDEIQLLDSQWPGETWRMVASSLACLLTGVLAALAPPSSPARASRSSAVNSLTLAEALTARDLAIKPDPEPIAKQVVLLAEDGTIIPLLSDDASRALFLDERLRNCRWRDPGPPLCRGTLSPGRLVQGRARRPASNSRVLLRRLRDQRTLPADLPLLSRPDGTAHAARKALIESDVRLDDDDECVRASPFAESAKHSDSAFSWYTAALDAAAGIIQDVSRRKRQSVARSGGRGGRGLDAGRDGLRVLGHTGASPSPTIRPQ